MSNRTRRNFLNTGLRVAAAASAGSLFRSLGLVDAMAQSAFCSDYKALVCVFLFGGNDGTNMVVPVQATQSYADYSRIRGVLAIAQSQLQQIQSGGSVLGLHPRLGDLRTLFENGKMAVALNVGTLVAPTTRAQYLASGTALPLNLFSHSDQQAEWQNSTSSSQTPTGWAGRVADLMSGCRANSTLPMVLSLTGNTVFGDGQQARLGTLIPGSTMGLQGFGTIPNPRYLAFQQMLEVDGGMTLVRAANRIASQGVSDSTLVNNATSAPTKLKTAFPNTTLGIQMRTVARMLEARESIGLQRQVFFCSLGGFDTHQNEISAQDSLMLQLGPALAALYNATVEMGISEQVTSFTASEFGRTVQANGNSGADHGWGSHHFVLGGAVKGGIYGRYPVMDFSGPDDANNRGVYIPTQAVDQYNATLARWFGVDDATLPKIFPNLSNFPKPTLGFV